MLIFYMKDANIVGLKRKIVEDNENHLSVSLSILPW